MKIDKLMTEIDTSKTGKYYFAMATQDFLLKEEPLEEILRERIYHYKNLGKPIDFWLILCPLFTDNLDAQNITQQFIKPLAAIVSHNPKFIQWIKLRMGFVITGSTNNFPKSSTYNNDIYQ